MDVGLRCAAPSPVMSMVADAMLAFMDELASLSLQGYLETKARSAQSQEEWRHRLLRLILERPAAPLRAITELADLVGWEVPDEVSLVAVEQGPGRVAALPADALADLGGAQPHLLLPGQVEPCRGPALEAALAGRRAAVGLSVPIADAAQSLRWARRALALSRAGIFGDGQVTFCEEYLVELWLLADEGLIDQLGKRRLGALDALSRRSGTGSPRRLARGWRRGGPRPRWPAGFACTRRQCGTGCVSWSGPSAVSSTTQMRASPWSWCCAPRGYESVGHSRGVGGRPPRRRPDAMRQPTER